MRYLLIVFACMFIFQANGQCRGFCKTNCKESLGGYVSTGETNTSELKPGEKHQFMATFYKGQHYRIAICSDESLGNMQFTIRNAKKDNCILTTMEKKYLVLILKLHLLNN